MDLFWKGRHMDGFRSGVWDTDTHVDAFPCYNRLCGEMATSWFEEMVSVLQPNSSVLIY